MPLVALYILSVLIAVSVTALFGWSRGLRGGRLVFLVVAVGLVGGIASGAGDFLPVGIGPPLALILIVGFPALVVLSWPTRHTPQTQRLLVLSAMSAALAVIDLAFFQTH
jgi:hypothetical protein